MVRRRKGNLESSGEKWNTSTQWAITGYFFFDVDERSVCWYLSSFHRLIKSKKRTRTVVVVPDGSRPLASPPFRLFNSSVSFVCLRLGADVTDELDCCMSVVVVVVVCVVGEVVVVDVLVVEVDDVVLGTTDPLVK